MTMKTCNVKKMTKGLLVSFFILFCVMPIYSQNTTVSGIVTDNVYNEPLIGVTIMIEGTSIGTVTDIDGEFILNDVPADAILDVSFVGMQPQRISVDGRNVIDIILLEETELLDEIVVVGYGQQSRAQMSSSVSKVDTKVLKNTALTNVGSALQGMVPGLSIQNTTGQPGSTPKIIMRGGTDWDGEGTPLILVDGIVSSFEGLHSEDIESIEVLKDAAATSIYGARAANGVILITTKTGNVGPTRVSYNFKLGFNKPRETYEYLNAHDFIYYNRLGIKQYTDITGISLEQRLNGPGFGFSTGNNTTNSSFTTMILSDENRHLLNYEGWNTMADPLDPSKEIIYMENDMSRLFFQNSNLQDHYISVDGGNDKGVFSLGLGVVDDKGIVIGSEYKRFSGLLNASHKIRDNITISANVRASQTNETPTYIEHSTTFNIFERALGQPPTSRIYDNNPDGSLSNELNPGTNTGFGNPLYYKDKFMRNVLHQKLEASTGLDWNILPELKFSLRGSYSTLNLQREGFDKAHLNGGSYVTTRTSTLSNMRRIINQYTATLNYFKTFNDDHNISVMIGAEYYNDEIFNSSAATRNSPTDFIPTMNAGSEASGVPSSTLTGNRINSIFSRITYDYQMKYLLNLNVRRDGSTKLANKKHGVFPGISFGWNLHNEEFFKSLQTGELISLIKPRVSYGVNGNVDVLSDFGVFGQYGNLGIYNSQTGYGNTVLPTPDLRWEKSTTFNIGLDLGIIDNRVRILADYFIRDIKDKIAEQTLPYWTGFNSIITNNGTLRNKGFETELQASIVRNRAGWNWNISSTIFTVKNYVVKLPENDNEFNRQGGTQIFNPNTNKVEWVGGLQEGKRVGIDEVYSHFQESIYSDQASIDSDSEVFNTYFQAGTERNRYLGDVKWKDVDGNNIIDQLDRVYIGRTTPNIMGGFTSDLNYKGLSLYVKLDYALGHVALSQQRLRGITQVQGNQNSTTEVLSSWSVDNPNTDVPRYDVRDPQSNHKINNRYWEKADYLSIREVTVSYDFDTELIDKYVNQLRVYVSGSNLHYFTGYSGYAPEEGGEDWGRYPLPKSLTFGLNISF